MGQQEPTIRERLVAGALDLIAREGATDLSVRKLAQAADRTTMCVYSKFGSRSGLLDEVYRQAADQFLATLAGAGTIESIADRFHEYAVSRPLVYAFLFDDPMAVCDLDPGLRRDLLGGVITLIAEAGGGDRGVAQAQWVRMHGLMSLARVTGDVPSTAQWCEAVLTR